MDDRLAIIKNLQETMKEKVYEINKKQVGTADKTPSKHISYIESSQFTNNKNEPSEWSSQIKNQQQISSFVVDSPYRYQ